MISIKEGLLAGADDRGRALLILAGITGLARYSVKAIAR